MKPPYWSLLLVFAMAMPVSAINPDAPDYGKKPPHVLTQYNGGYWGQYAVPQPPKWENRMVPVPQPPVMQPVWMQPQVVQRGWRWQPLRALLHDSWYPVYGLQYTPSYPR